MIILKNRFLLMLLLFIQQGVSVSVFGQSNVSVPQLEGKNRALSNDSVFQADALYYEAQKARLKGEDLDAERLLRKVIELNPNNGGAYYDLSRITFKQNRFDKSKEYIEKAILLDSGNVWYKRQYAEILTLGNKFEEAAGQFMQIAATEKYNQNDLLKAAKLYQHVGKYKEALTALDILLKYHNDNEEAIEQKKSLYLKMNDVDAVVKMVQQQIRENPNEGQYYAELAELYDNNKMPEKAKELYEKLEKEFKDEGIVQYRLAAYYKRNNDEKKYNEFIKKLALNKELSSENRVQIMQELILDAANDTNKRKDRVELIKQVAEQFPGEANTHSFYGRVLLLIDNNREAIKEFKTSLEIDPSSYDDWEQLLRCYAVDKQNADSLLRYSDKALRLFPNQAMLHYLKGVGYFNKDDFNTCIKNINRALDMLPEERKDEMAEMYTRLGDAYYFAKQYPLSDSSFENALKLQPGNLYVLNNYSYYLSVRGTRLEEAERMSKKTIDIAKDEPSFLDTYGWILYKQGKYDKALVYVQQAIDFSADNADGTLWDHLGDVNYKLGNVDKAVECWKKAKAKGTDSTDIDRKIKDRKLYES